MHHRFSNTNLHTPVFVLALMLLGLLTAGGIVALTQMRMAPGTLISPSAEAAAVNSYNIRNNTSDNSANTSQAEMGPGWSTLSTPQKLALYPLAERWLLISEAQKRRWLTLATNFSNLSPEEQQKFHERITDWGNLSAQQRNQARLNFAVTNKLARDDKRAQWEAYQALSEDERSALAARATIKPTGAATALRPVPTRKLAQVPAATEASPNRPNVPKIPTFTIPASRTVAPVFIPLASPNAIGLPASGSTIVTPAGVETAPIGMPSAVSAPLPPLVTNSNDSATAATSSAPVSTDTPNLPPP